MSLQNPELDFSPHSSDVSEHSEEQETAYQALFSEAVASSDQMKNTASDTNTNRFPSPFGRGAESTQPTESRMEATNRPAEVEKKVEWADNLSDGFRRAMAENKPLVLVFGADWCDKCVTLKREVLGMKKDPGNPNSSDVPGSQEFNNGFADRAIFVFANPDKDDRFGNVKQKMTELGIDSFPTMVILEVPSMQERARVTGRWEKGIYIQKMNEAFRGRSDAPVQPIPPTNHSDNSPPRTVA